MRMKKYSILSPILLVFITVSCKLTDPVSDYINKIAPANADKLSSVISSFPLEVENQWEYKAEINIGILENGTVTRSITGTENISGVDCYVIQDEFDVGEVKSTDINYWIQIGNELIWYAYGTEAGTSKWLPSNFSAQTEMDYSFKRKILINLGDTFNFIKKTKADNNVSAYIPKIVSPPRKLLIFPLVLGKEWQNESEGLNITRKVVALETITVPAGIFTCAKVQYIIDFDIDVFMWYSSIGLVKSYIFTTIEIRDEQGNPLEELETYEIYELQSYTLVESQS